MKITHFQQLSSLLIRFLQNGIDKEFFGFNIYGFFFFVFLKLTKKLR